MIHNNQKVQDIEILQFKGNDSLIIVSAIDEITKKEKAYVSTIKVFQDILHVDENHVRQTLDWGRKVSIEIMEPLITESRLLQTDYGRQQRNNILRVEDISGVGYINIPKSEMMVMVAESEEKGVGIIGLVDINLSRPEALGSLIDFNYVLPESSYKAFKEIVGFEQIVKKKPSQKSSF